MRKIKIALIFAVCLLFVTSAVTAQKAKNTITNADVVEMVKAALPESTIILAIQQSEPNFDTSPKALIELSKQGVSQKVMDAMLQPRTLLPPVSLFPNLKPTQPKPAETDGVASKDIGSLRVVLKSVLPISGGDRMRCNFEFINLETQKPIVVAMNAISGSINYLRSTLVDENGVLWSLNGSDVTGAMGKVAVYQQTNGGLYDPAEIVTVLSKRDDLNANIANGYTFIYGSTAEILPGQSVTVNAIFAKSGNSDKPSKVFQMASEIVVGIANSGTKKSYTLYNLTFDKISLPTK
jgi:hypothetical protein